MWPRRSKRATPVKKRHPKSKWVLLPAFGLLTACGPGPSDSASEELTLRIAPLGDYAWKDRRQTGQPVEMKPEEERRELLDELTARPADLILIRGLGSEAALEHLQQALNERGHPYPERFYIPGNSAYRGIGFLGQRSWSDYARLSERTYRIQDRHFTPLAGGIHLQTDAFPNLWIWNAEGADPSSDYERRRNDIRLLVQTLQGLLDQEHAVLLSLQSREALDSPIIRQLEELELVRLSPVDETGDSWTHRAPDGIHYLNDQWIFASPEVAERMENRTKVLDSPELREAGPYRHQWIRIP